MRPGTYYRPASRELAVILGDEAPPGRGWQPLTGRTDLGLVALRALLVERGVVGNRDVRAYYWHMPPTEGSETSVFKGQTPDAQAS